MFEHVGRQAGRRYQPLVVVLAAMCAGIVADRHWPLECLAWLSLAGGGFAAWWGLWWRRWVGGSAVALLIAIAAASGAWHHLQWKEFDPGELGRAAREAAQPVCVIVEALNSPRIKPALPPDPLIMMPPREQSRLSARVVRVRDGDQWQDACGQVSLTVDGHLDGINSGDRLLVYAQMTRPPAPLNPGEFHMANHERARRKLVWLRATCPDCVRLLQRGSPWHAARYLNNIRDRGGLLLARCIRQPHAGLAGALLLGFREQIQPQRTESFFTTGTIHILSISGLHVGILAYGFWLLARLALLPRRLMLAMVALFVIAYATLTDAGPPVARAAILVTVMCLAQALGRASLAFNTLAAAGIIVLMWNPAGLFDVGTQLSFLAVASLIGCGSWARGKFLPDDPLDRLIVLTRPWPILCLRWLALLLRDTFVVSLVVTLVTTPLVWYRFQLISPVALVLNPLVALPVAVALFAGFGVLVLGWLPLVGNACGWLCDVNLGVIEYLIETGRSLPASHAWWPGPSLSWLLVFYSVLGFVMLFPRGWFPRRWLFALSAAWATLGAWPTNLSLPTKSASDEPAVICTFIAVGHGTSVLVELPSGQKLLYDAGRLGSPHLAAQAVESVLWSRGITHLDAVMISHADLDHYNAIPELLRRFSVGTVYVSPVMFERAPPGLVELQRAIRAANVPIREVYANDRLRTDDGTYLDILHPPRKGVLGSDNANSIVLRIEFAGRRLLLTGDLESPGMEDVLAEAPLDCDVVLAPHHGSAHSSPRGFAAWSTPEWVIVSAGVGRDIRAVRSAYETAGGNVLNTAEVGAVRVRLSRSGVDVRSWRENPW